MSEIVELKTHIAQVKDLLQYLESRLARVEAIEADMQRMEAFKRKPEPAAAEREPEPAEALPARHPDGQPDEMPSSPPKKKRQCRPMGEHLHLVPGDFVVAECGWRTGRTWYKFGKVMHVTGTGKTVHVMPLTSEMEMTPAGRMVKPGPVSVFEYEKEFIIKADGTRGSGARLERWQRYTVPLPATALDD